MTATLIERLAPFKTRALTRGELMIARYMFADEQPFSKVRIVQLPRLGFGAMAPLRSAIVFSGWNAACDFCGAPLSERGWFVHELTHIWQALGGAIMPLAKLGALGAHAYAYEYLSGKPFTAYNIEQQAEIGRHLFLARHGAPDPRAPPADALEAVWPINSDSARPDLTRDARPSC